MSKNKKLPTAQAQTQTQKFYTRKEICLELKISRSTLYRKLKKAAISLPPTLIPYSKYRQITQKLGILHEGDTY
ncbi:MAG: helix-turn-helix domain-containing protein [Bacteroidetes bacterium]|nr:helix-turn-helix domain-containing protein [Bacteroidota bacterium]